MDDAIGSWVSSCRELVWFCDQAADDKHKHVVSFLHAFHNRHDHHGNCFTSTPSLLFFRGEIRFRGAAAAINENNIATEMAAMWD